jgi:hypothetical protein
MTFEEIIKFIEKQAAAEQRRALEFLDGDKQAWQIQSSAECQVRADRLYYLIWQLERKNEESK